MWTGGSRAPFSRLGLVTRSSAHFSINVLDCAVGIKMQAVDNIRAGEDSVQRGLAFFHRLSRRVHNLQAQRLLRVLHHGFGFAVKSAHLAPAVEPSARRSPRHNGAVVLKQHFRNALGHGFWV